MKTLFQNWRGSNSFANYVKINIHYGWNHLKNQSNSNFKRNTIDFAILVWMLWVAGVFINTCTQKIVNQNEFWLLRFKISSFSHLVTVLFWSAARLIQTPVALLESKTYRRNSNAVRAGWVALPASKNATILIFYI